MALYPGAKVRLLDRKFAGYNALNIFNRVNLHVAVSMATSLFGFFNRPARPSCHVYILKNGGVEQSVDSDRQAEADLEGNDATLSVETQGGLFKPNSEPWTDAQLEAIARFVAWAHVTHGIALKLATDSKIGPSSHGLSWHRLGVDGNFPSLPDIRAGRLQRGGGMHYSKSRGKACPGDAKIRQIPGILERAKEIVAAGHGHLGALPHPEPEPTPPDTGTEPATPVEPAGPIPPLATGTTSTTKPTSTTDSTQIDPVTPEPPATTTKGSAAMTALIDLIPAAYRQFVYAALAGFVFMYGIWQAQDGDWGQTIIAIVTAAASTMASANTRTTPIHPDNDALVGG